MSLPPRQERSEPTPYLLYKVFRIPESWMFHVLAYYLKGAARNVYSSIDLQGKFHQLQRIPKRHQEHPAALPPSHASMRGEHACDLIASLELPRLLVILLETNVKSPSILFDLCGEEDAPESTRNDMNCNELSLAGLTITSDIHTSGNLSFSFVKYSISGG